MPIDYQENQTENISYLQTAEGAFKIYLLDLVNTA